MAEVFLLLSVDFEHVSVLLVQLRRSLRFNHACSNRIHSNVEIGALKSRALNQLLDHCCRNRLHRVTRVWHVALRRRQDRYRATSPIIVICVLLKEGESQ